MLRLILTAWFAAAGTVATAEIDIQTITSEGGINAWVVEEPSIPFAALEIRIRGGASLDAPGKTRCHKSDDGFGRRRGG